MFNSDYVVIDSNLSWKVLTISSFGKICWWSYNLLSLFSWSFSLSNVGKTTPCLPSMTKKPGEGWSRWHLFATWRVSWASMGSNGTCIDKACYPILWNTGWMIWDYIWLYQCLYMGQLLNSPLGCGTWTDRISTPSIGIPDQWTDWVDHVHLTPKP